MRLDCIYTHEHLKEMPSPVVVGFNLVRGPSKGNWITLCCSQLVIAREMLSVNFTLRVGVYYVWHWIKIKIEENEKKILKSYGMPL